MKRRRRVRGKVSGTATRPRLAVFRSSAHVSAQLIDDNSGTTLVAASDREMKGGKPAAGETKAIAAARGVGELLATRAKEKGIATVIFDRGGFAYHGRIKALAEAARAGGLQF
jgi:large subunit ribosomal protein L18